MRDGYIGYQYMAWLEMGNILLAICGVVQMRNLLYIFGAISMVMILAVAFLDKLIADRKSVLATQTVEENGDEIGADESAESDGEKEDVIDAESDGDIQDEPVIEDAPVEDGDAPEMA